MAKTKSKLSKEAKKVLEIRWGQKSKNKAKKKPPKGKFKTVFVKDLADFFYKIFSVKI